MRDTKEKANPRTTILETKIEEKLDLDLEKVEKDLFPEKLLDHLKINDETLYNEIMESFELVLDEETGAFVLNEKTDKTEWETSLDTFVAKKQEENLEVKRSDFQQDVETKFKSLDDAEIKVTANANGLMTAEIGGSSYPFKIEETNEGKWRLSGIEYEYTSSNTALIDARILWKTVSKLDKGELLNTNTDDSEYLENPFGIEGDQLTWIIEGLRANTTIDSNVIQCPQKEMIVDFANLQYKKSLISPSVSGKEATAAPDPGTSEQDMTDTTEILDEDAKDIEISLDELSTRISLAYPELSAKVISDEDFYNLLLETLDGSADASETDDDYEDEDSSIGDVDYKASIDHNFFTKTEKTDANPEHLTIHLPSEIKDPLVQKSRIHHFIGPKGAAITVDDDDLANTKLKSGGETYVWGDDTKLNRKSWVSESSGKRLLIFNGTEIDVIRTEISSEGDEESAEDTPKEITDEKKTIDSTDLDVTETTYETSEEWSSKEEKAVEVAEKWLAENTENVTIKEDGVSILKKDDTDNKPWDSAIDLFERNGDEREKEGEREINTDDIAYVVQLDVAKTDADDSTTNGSELFAFDKDHKLIAFAD